MAQCAHAEEIVDDSFYRNGLKFSCQRCSSCCRHDPGIVNISRVDLDNLLKWSNLDEDRFISEYCRWVPKPDGFEYLCLKEKENFDCILWDNGCLAYELRPFQCSSYPFWAALVQDEDWWEANAQECPGVNKGPIHNKEEIEAYLTRRRAEPYIRRKAV
jgi:Fe-S-cluster containining protein